MEEMNEDLKKYYEYLKSANADVPDNYDSFEKTLSDENTSKDYYNYLKENKFDTPDTYDSFSNTFGLKKKVSYEDFQTSARGSSQMPKEYESEVPSTTTKKPSQEEEIVKDIKGEIENIYYSKGELAPNQKFERFKGQSNNMQQIFEPLIQERTSKQDSLTKQYKERLNTLAKEFGGKVEDNKVSVPDDKVDEYNQTNKQLYEEYINNFNVLQNEVNQINEKYTKNITDVALGLGLEIDGDGLKIPEKEQSRFNEIFDQAQTVVADKYSRKAEKEEVEKYKDQGFFTEMGKLWKSGSYRALSSIPGIRTYADDIVFEFISKPIAKAKGATDEEISVLEKQFDNMPRGTFGITSNVAKYGRDYLKNKSDMVRSTAKKYETTISESIVDEEYGKAVRQIFGGMVESAPQMVILAASSGAGTLASFSSMLMTSASDRYADLEGNNKLTNKEKIGNAALYGTFEAAGEMWTKYLFDGIGLSLKGLGKEELKKATSKIADNFIVDVLGESASEGLVTDLGQQLTDYYMGVRSNIDWGQIFDASAVGFGMGTTFSGAKRGLRAIVTTADEKVRGKMIASPEDVSKFKEITNQLVDLQKQKETAPNKAALDIINEQAEKLDAERLDIANKNIEDAKALNKKEFKGVSEINQAINEYDNKIEKAKETKEDATNLETIREELLNKRKSIIDGAKERVKTQQKNNITPVNIQTKELYDVLDAEGKKHIDSIKDKVDENRLFREIENQATKTTQGNKLLEKYKAQKVLTDTKSTIVEQIVAQRTIDKQTPFNGAEISDIQKIVNDIESGKEQISDLGKEIKLYYEGINKAKKQIGEEVVEKQPIKAAETIKTEEPTKPIAKEKEALKQSQIKEEFKPFADIVNESKTVDEAFAKIQEIKDVPDEVSKTFREQYDPEETKTPKQAFEQFYNEVKQPQEVVVEETARIEVVQENVTPTQVDQVSVPKENKAEKVEPLTPKEANTRVRGVEQGIFQETNSAQQKFVQELVDSNKESYDVLSLQQATEDAKQYIADQGSVDEAYEKLKNNKDSGEDLATRQVARLSLIDYYSRKAINPNVSKAEQDVAIEKVMTLEKVLAREATKYGQASAVLAIWKSMQPEGILRLEERKIAEYNDKILKKKIVGKVTVEQQIDKVVETIDKEAQEAAKDIVAKSKKYQASKNNIANKGTKRTPKRTEVNKEKIKAEKDYRQKRIEEYKANKGKTLSAAILPGITQAEIEFAGDMIASYVREGFYRLNDLTTKLKEEFKSLGVELTDKQVKQILAQEKDGKKLETSLREKEVEIDLKLKAKEEGLKIGTKEQSIRVAKQLDDIVTKHWTEKEAIGQSLAQKFIDEAGLSASEAKELESIVLEEFKKQVFEKSQKELTKLIGKSVLPKQKARQKSVTEKLLSALNLGALDTDFYKELFAEYFGLQKITPEQAKTIVAKAEKLQRLKGTGRFEQKASKELIDYVYELYPRSKTSEFVAMWEGLIYSSMLSGPFTSILNISSAGSNILLRPLTNLTNVVKWVSVLKTHKGDKTAYNPFRDIIAGWEGMKAGSTIAKGIYKGGGVETKFIEQTSKDNIYKTNELERPKFGEGKRFRPIKIAGADLNIFNYFKYSGRNLAAQDKIMFNTIHDMEMAAVIADKYYAEGFRGKTLREKVISEVKGANIDQDMLNTRLDNEISLYEEVTGNKATKLDTEIRKREIMLDMLDLTIEEKEEIDQIARSNIFTDDRHGTVAHMTQMLGTAANKGPLTKVFIKPFFMFTKIVGNVTEYMLDSTPIGILRAEGLSLTGAYKRFVDPDIQTSQMGERGSRLYYEQMGRALFGTTAMVVAAAASLGNDDDDWFEITGGRNEEGYKRQGRQNVTPNYVVRFGDTEIPYKNVPLLAMPLSFIGNINDALKTDMSEEELIDRITATLLLDAGFNSITMVKDMSIVEGLGSLLQLGTDVVNGGKWGEVTTETVNRYITIAAKPLPQNTGLVQQTWQFFDRKSYSKKDVKEVLAYSAGIQHLTNNINRDQLGDEVVSAPGETLLPYLHWANIKGHDERWQFLSKYNAIPERIFNHQIQIETKDGIEKRKMTSDEYNEYTKLVGKRLSDGIVKYYNTTDLETRKKEIEVDNTTDKEYTGVQFDVKEIAKEAKSDAITTLFRWGVAKDVKPKEFALAAKYNALKPYLNDKTITTETNGSKTKYKLDKSELYRFNTLTSLKYLDLMNKMFTEETLKTLSSAEYTDVYGRTVTALDNATTALWNQAQQEVIKNSTDQFLDSERVATKTKK